MSIFGPFLEQSIVRCRRRHDPSSWATLLRSHPRGLASANRQRSLLSALAALACLCAPRGAAASGFELTPPGGRDLGRAGASVVGSDSALGMLYNPATLLASKSMYDADAALHVNMQQTCFTRTAVIETDGDRVAGETLPKVCSEGGPGLIPQLALSARFGKQQRFAVGLGVYAPSTGVRDLQYGDPDTARISSSPGSVYAPSRYLLLSENLMQIFPTLAVAYEPHRRIRLGASFGSGVSTFDFTVGAFTRTVVLQSPEAGATSEATTQVSGKDVFTPRVQAGLWGIPFDSLPLELGLAFTFTGNVEATDSTLRVRGVGTEYYPSSLLGEGGLLGNPGQPDIRATVHDVTVKMPMISTLTVGARYAQRLHEPADSVGDRLSSERFDVELNASAIFAERLDAIRVEVPATTIIVPSPSPIVPDVPLMLPENIKLEQRWSNQFQLRLGGDYSVLPGRLALRAGGSYESHGVKRGYEQLAFTPYGRYGIHAGATVRIMRWLDVSASYVFFITPEVRVSANQASVRRQVSGSPRPGDDELANAGLFRQTASAFAAQISTRF